jgi:hypothetical protein
MADMLLINPSHRPSRRKARKPASAAQLRARAAFAAAARSRSKNPAKRRPARRAAAHAAPRRSARRRNPIHATARRHTRRRRNPIGLGGGMRGIVGQLKHALIGGAGAVGMDIVMGQLNRFMPAALKSDPSTVGVGDAVKAVATVLLGQLLRKPTRGLSTQLAAGALTVQAADILRSFVPAGMQVAYYAPARIVRGSPRIGPNMQNIAPGMARYLLPNATARPASVLHGVGATRNSQLRVR